MYVTLRDLQRCVWNNTLYWSGKVDSFYGSTLPKVRIISKNASNKSCLELNFVQKTLQVHMFISHRSGARSLQRLICLKYYSVLKWERFTLEFNTAKITDYIKKHFK